MGTSAQRLDGAWWALPWWQKLTQREKYTWRYDCLWLLSHTLKQEEERKGLNQDIDGPRIDWIAFLDAFAQALVRDWNMLPWWTRRRSASKFLTWLAYLQEVREDSVRGMAELHASAESHGFKPENSDLRLAEMMADLRCHWRLHPPMNRED